MTSILHFLCSQCTLRIGLNASLRVETAVPAVLAAGALGMVFGVVPALRAAGMQPVEALREE